MSAISYAQPLVRKFEGCRLTAYRCPAGVLTIGWGHTGPEVTEGLVWTQAQADAALDIDLAEALSQARSVVSVDLTDKQWAALASFVFNLGIGSFRHSTLLQRINGREFSAALREFDKWTLAGGKRLNGLVARRAAEQALFKEAI